MAHKTGLEEYYVIRGSEESCFGYTTGSCAAAACKGAALMLLGKKKLDSVPLMTPKEFSWIWNSTTFRSKKTRSPALSKKTQGMTRTPPMGSWYTPPYQRQKNQESR